MSGMGGWKKAPAALVRTFEEVMATLPQAQPRKMFGYPAAFIQGQMFAGVFQDRFFVRLDDEGRAELARHGGRPFEPMPGRAMREYAELPPAVMRSRPALTRWVRRAFDYAAALPPKAEKARAAAKAAPGRAKAPRRKGGP